MPFSESPRKSDHDLSRRFRDNTVTKEIILDLIQRFGFTRSEIAVLKGFRESEVLALFLSVGLASMGWDKTGLRDSASKFDQ